jgi:hypothetical protein
MSYYSILKLKFVTKSDSLPGFFSKEGHGALIVDFPMMP